MRYIIIAFACLIFGSCSKNEGCFSYSENGKVVFTHCSGSNKHKQIDNRASQIVLEKGGDKLVASFLDNKPISSMVILERDKLKIPLQEEINSTWSINGNLGMFEGFFSYENDATGDIYEVRYWDLVLE